MYICMFLGRGYTFTKFLKCLHITPLSFLAGARFHSLGNSLFGRVRKPHALTCSCTSLASTARGCGLARTGRVLPTGTECTILLPPSEEVTTKNQTLPALLLLLLHDTLGISHPQMELVRPDAESHTPKILLIITQRLTLGNYMQIMWEIIH